MKEQLEELALRLEAAIPRVVGRPIVAGFDAFVDEVIEVVGIRQSPESYARVPTIPEYGEWVKQCGGKSGLREFVVTARIAGGCTVNMGDGLATLGFPLDAFAGVGEPCDEVFHDFQKKCRSLHTLGMAPGRALVTEFDDGKLMLCAFSHFARFTPEYLRAAMADGRWRQACEEAAALVFTSWSVYPYMTACWKMLQKEMLHGLAHRPRIFLDLADPASRAPEDLVAMVDALPGFEEIGPATLSLNGNEAHRLARALGLEEAGAADLERLAKALCLRAGIEEVGIHLVDSAVSATREETCRVAGPHCARPRKSVGAGDRFNAGWLAGYLLELETANRLLLAAAASGFFVRAARSGTLKEIASFLRHWAAGNPEAGFSPFAA